MMHQVAFVLLLFFSFSPNCSPVTEEMIHHKSSRHSTIDHLLHSLPASFFKNFSLIKEMRNGTQFASPEFPRIINFSKKGNLFIAYTGKRELLGSHELKIISQLPNGNFRFSRVIEDEGKLVIDFDSSSCFKCHFGKPIWGTYPFWTNAYGSHHDLYKDPRVLTRDTPEALDYASVNLSIQEIKQLEHFKANSAQVGRYKLLPDLKTYHYTDLSNLNSFLGDVVETSFYRSLISFSLNSTYFWDLYEIYSDVFLIDPPEKRSYKLSDLERKVPKNIFNEFVEFKKIHTVYDIDYYQNIFQRSRSAQTINEIKDFRKFLIHYELSLSFLRFIFFKIGAPDNLWEYSALQKISTPMGGGFPPPYRFNLELMTQIEKKLPLKNKIKKIRGSKSYLSDLKMLNSDGFQYIKDHLHLIEDSKVNFFNIKDLYPKPYNIKWSQYKKCAVFLKQILKEEIIEYIKKRRQ